jgi:hypothetical protein
MDNSQSAVHNKLFAGNRRLKLLNFARLHL